MQPVDPRVDMRADLRRLALGLLALFGVVALSAMFWGVIRSSTLLAREDNVRSVIREQRIARGAIIDRDGEVLAYSAPDRAGVMQRHYPEPAAAGAVGYYSFTYGTAGIEAAYDETLSGDARRTELEQALDRALHRVQQGSDIHATVDRDVQTALASALGARSGAALLVEVPSGRILGMVSTPGYDPNLVGENWDTLTREEDSSPLLNRVTAGLYQPGGALQPVILAALLGANPELGVSGSGLLNVIIEGARSPVRVDDLALRCLDGVPRSGALTLAEAFAYGCPAPFADALNVPAQDDTPLTAARIWERYANLGLLVSPDLDGFQTEAGPPPRPFDENTPAARLQAELVGQGALTVTPLHMIQVVAAVANRGNGVPLYLVEAVRPPDATAWQPVDVPVEQPALFRQDVAAALRLAMLQAAAESEHVQAAQPREGPGAGRALYGHAALAYSGPGETPFAWFQGFLDLTDGDDRRALAVVVVIADEHDPGAAAAVARAGFEAALVH